MSHDDATQRRGSVSMRDEASPDSCILAYCVEYRPGERLDRRLSRLWSRRRCDRLSDEPRDARLRYVRPDVAFRAIALTAVAACRHRPVEPLARVSVLGFGQHYRWDELVRLGTPRGATVEATVEVRAR